MDPVIVGSLLVAAFFGLGFLFWWAIHTGWPFPFPKVDRHMEAREAIRRERQLAFEEWDADFEQACLDSGAVVDIRRIDRVKVGDVVAWRLPSGERYARTPSGDWTRQVDRLSERLKTSRTSRVRTVTRYEVQAPAASGCTLSRQEAMKFAQEGMYSTMGAHENGGSE